MNKNINIKDYFKVDDSHSRVRGFVVMRKENGDIVFAKENMIVKTGRTAIFNAVTSGTDISFTKIVYGSGSQLPVEGDTALKNAISAYSTDLTSTSTINKIYDANDDLDAVLTADANGMVQTNVMETSASNLYIRFCSTITGTAVNTSAYIRELGIICGTDTLFSRIVFEGIPISSSTTYYLTYYIYF